MVKYVTFNELEELIAGEKPVVCDFWATWCGPCRMLAPVFEDVSDKFEGKAEFVKIDVDENEDAAVKYGITSIPNIIIFKNGKPAANNLGFVPENALTALFEKLGKNSGDRLSETEKEDFAKTERFCRHSSEQDHKYGRERFHGETRRV